MRLERELRGKEAVEAEEKAKAESSRGQGVREAWELVKDEEEQPPAADVRGVLPQDVEGGQADVAGTKRKPVKQARLLSLVIPTGRD